MQISDMLNQYNRNIANGVEISVGTKGIRQVASSLQQLSVGNIFEGSITHMENGVVTLGLSDGKTISARLDAGVSVRVGESMFFQVRSNNGSQIAIRPYSQAGGLNPALMQALKAANLPADGRMVTMVNSMMEQAMPIDKQSLAQMAKLVAGNVRMDVATIVQMAKLQIPVTQEMAAQFENYKSDQYAILDQLESAMETVSDALAHKNGSVKELLDFNRQMLKVLLGEPGAADGGKVIPGGENATEGVASKEGSAGKVLLSYDALAGKDTSSEAALAGKGAQAEAALAGKDASSGTALIGREAQAEGASGKDASSEAALIGREAQAEGASGKDALSEAAFIGKGAQAEGASGKDASSEAALIGKGAQAEGASGKDASSEAALIGKEVQTEGASGKDASSEAALIGKEAQAEDASAGKTDPHQKNVSAAGTVPSEHAVAAGTGERSAALQQSDTLKNLFGSSQLQQLSDQLAKIPELSQNPAVFQDGMLALGLTSKQFLQLLGRAFSSKNPFSRQALGDLISSKEYRTLIRSVMEQQWLLKPEELKGEHKVSELYERLDRQLEQMEKVCKAFGQSTSQLSETAANVRGNIQFMNQLNQNFAYVQIPLKLAGQNAHSDLYVYTDKRRKREKNDELTAFLHLDLDHLGSTDVSVRLKDRQVATNFYLADDASYRILLSHIELLEKRLIEKGYNARIQVKNQEENVNFVDEILKQGAPSAGGMVHRYSFDVRA